MVFEIVILLVLIFICCALSRGRETVIIKEKSGEELREKEDKIMHFATGKLYDAGFTQVEIKSVSKLEPTRPSTPLESIKFSLGTSRPDKYKIYALTEKGTYRIIIDATGKLFEMEKISRESKTEQKKR